jgi:hypothetical protein
MNGWLLLLIMGLAAARLTRLVVTDQISEPLRNWAYRRDPQMRHIGYIVSCPYCTGIYASGCVVALTNLAWAFWETPGGYAAAGVVVLLAVAQAALWLTPKTEDASAVTMVWKD